MSLSRATDARGRPIALPGAPPYPTEALRPLAGTAFRLPADDPWVRRSGTRSHAYLDGARKAWKEHPEWMDFLDPDSPAWDLKRAERDLYLHAWSPWLGAERVLDVGCGVGRITTAFLDRGASVWGVDADLLSLRHCLAHAVGRPGRLELHWSSVHQLPEVEVDVAVACEVLCYVPEADRALQAIVSRIRPGGALLISMEARWGWAAAEDAPPEAIEEALAGTGVLDLPGDRWVRTVDEAELRTLLEGAGLQVALLQPTHYLTDGPLERVMPRDLSLEQLLALEQRCRAHPVWAPLHRAWTAVGLRP